MSSICNDLCKLFERELRRRLETRSTKYASESMLLLSAFKFYDSLNTGYINKAQWINSFEKIGLTGFNDQDLGFLFDYYDNNQTGLINYRQFSLFLLNHNNYFTAQSYQSPISLHSRTKQYFDHLLESFRAKINIKGGLLYYLLLERMFKASYRMIHYDILSSCFRDLNIPTGVRDLKDFFVLIDANDSKWVGIEQMMRMIRGKLPLSRVNVLKKVFNRLDQARKRLIGIDDLFLCKNDARYGRGGERDAFDNFKVMMRIFCEWKRVKMLSLDDFMEFYEPISASIEDDNAFSEIVEFHWAFKPIGIEEEENNKEQLNYFRDNQRYDDFDSKGRGSVNRTNHSYYDNQPMHGSSPLLEEQGNLQMNDINEVTPFNGYNRLGNRPKLRRTPCMTNTPNYNQYNNLLNQHNESQGNLNKSNSHYISQSCRSKPLIPLSIPSALKKEATPNYQSFLNQVPKPNNTFLPPINNSPSINKSYSQPLMNGILSPQQPQSGGSPLQLNIQSKAINNLIQDLCNQSMKKLKKLIASRGEKGIFGLQRIFIFYDKGYTRRISLADLISLVQSYRLNLNQEEIEAIYSMYSIDNNGLMNYDNFLSDLIGEMNQNRQNLIRQLFIQLDKLNKGFLNIDSIKEEYNSVRHPEVIEGKKTAEEIFGEWLDNIEAFCLYYNLPIRNRAIYLEEFLTFYSQISFSLPGDNYFDYLIYNVWNISFQHFGKRRNIHWN